MRTSWRQTFLLVAIVAVLGVGLVYPILLTVGGAFRTDDGGFTLRHIASVFEDPATRRGLLNATLIAAITTTMAIIMALPLAVVGARYAFPGKTFLGGLLLLPLVLPPFVGAIGVRHLLGRAGALNAAFGLDIDWLGNAASGRSP
jgi:iron(III) transport system permease protein